MAKLKENDLIEFKKRRELVNCYILTAQALDYHINTWLNLILKGEGLDITKNYEVDINDGTIKEIKKEEKPNEQSGDKKVS